jgi:chromosome segregation ATPase
LGALSEDNYRCKNRIAELENELSSCKRSHYEERIKLQHMFEESDKAVLSLHTQQQLLMQRYHTETEQKNSAIRQLEAECSKLRVDASQYESQKEALNSEMGELHSAMASLHGEISALQKDLQETQERERRTANQKKELSIMLEMKETDLVKLKVDKEKVDGRVVSLEQKIFALNERIAGMSESQGMVDNLMLERESMQSVITQMESRAKQQASTNQELNTLLGKLHSDVQRLQQELVESRDSNLNIMAKMDSKEESLKAELHSLQAYKQDLESANAAARKECEGLIADMLVWKERGEALQADQRKQAKRIERLEREKHELFIELGDKSKEAERFNADLQISQASIKEMKQSLDEGKIEIEALKRKISAKDDEISKLTSELLMLRETAEALNNKLKEEVARNEQVIEAARNQQRENANRVVDFSQKNAKLTVDLNMALGEIENLKQKLSSFDATLATAHSEKEEVIRQHNATRARLMALEDRIEEMVAKTEAAEAEAEEYRRLHQEGADARAKEALAQRQSFEQEMRKANELFQSELEEKNLALTNAKRQAEQNAERSIARARETFQRQIEELQAIRKREQQDFNARTAAVTSAMEGLQRELREEAIKSNAVSEELFALREQLENQNRDDDFGEKIQRLERERARDRVKFEGMIQNLRDELSVTTEKLERAEQQCDVLQQRVAAEKEARNSNLQKLRLAEEDFAGQQSLLDAANNEISNLKKQLREIERKSNTTLASKEAEITRLVRRSDVLSEAVNRLTAGGGSAAISSLTAELAAINKAVPTQASVSNARGGLGGNPSSSTAWEQTSASESLIAGQSDGPDNYSSPQPTQAPLRKHNSEIDLSSGTNIDSNRPNSARKPKIPPTEASQMTSLQPTAKNAPPSAEDDVASHLMRVQNALDRRKNGNKGPAPGELGRVIQAPAPRPAVQPPHTSTEPYQVSVTPIVGSPEDASRPASNDSSNFAQRIRVQVEQTKDIRSQGPDFDVADSPDMDRRRGSGGRGGITYLPEDLPAAKGKNRAAPVKR